MIKNNNFNLSANAQVCNNLDYPIKLDNDKKKKNATFDNDKKELQSGKTERSECSADTKLFFDDVYNLGTRGKKQQVDVLQYGRSMIEMLGVLAIVGVLSVGGIAGYSKAMQKFKINKTIDQISQTIANIQTLHMQQATFEGATSYIAEGAELYFPDSVNWTDLEHGEPINPFNGRYYIDSYTSHEYINFYASLLPKEACITLITQDWGNILADSIIGVSVSDDNIISSALDVGLEKDCNTEGNYFACKPYLPVTVAKASEMCSSNDDALTVQIAIKK